MVGFPKYESYKDSGNVWVQEIPTNWKIERAKWLYKRMDRPVRKEDEVITAFRDGEVTLRKNRREDGFTNALQEHGYQGIRKGDLVIHAMDAFAGAIGVSDSDGKSTPVYSVCTPRSEFYVNNYYWFFPAFGDPDMESSSRNFLLTRIRGDILVLGATKDKRCD